MEREIWSSKKSRKNKKLNLPLLVELNSKKILQSNNETDWMLKAMKQEQSSQANNLLIAETLQTTSAIDLDEQPSFGYDGLLEILLMGAVTIAGFKFLYRKSRLYLDRTHPLKQNIWQKFAQPNCQQCRFYNCNSSFKCSVHPSVLEFSKAKNCPDYWQRDRHRFLYR